VTVKSFAQSLRTLFSTHHRLKRRRRQSADPTRRRREVPAVLEGMERRLMLTVDVSLVGGNLLVEDAGGSTDDLTISTDAGDVVISDSANNIVASGFTGDGTPTVRVPIASITNNQMQVNAGAGDDNLTVDFSSGPLGSSITFDGGAGTDTISAIGDADYVLRGQSSSGATFSGVGDLAGGSVGSNAFGLSGDGSVIVGDSTTASGNEAFRWTAGGGIVGLGELSGGAFAGVALDASSDGSVIVGQSESGSGPEAFRWTSSGGITGLGDIAGGVFSSTAWGVSDDGAVVSGRGRSATNRAFRWTDGSGIVDIGDLGGSGFTEGMKISGDGSAVIGWSNNASGNIEAFRYSSGTGMVGLGDIAGGSFFSQALAISQDGTTVVGRSDGGSGNEAFRWTSASGMVALGHLPGGTETRGMDVSGDGSIVVGFSTVSGSSEATIWDSANGMRNLKDVLTTDHGLDLTGWTLTTARGISDDGLTISGTGINPVGDTEGWVVDLSATLDSSTGGRIRLAEVENASLTGGTGNNTLDASGFSTGGVTLDGGGGSDTLIGTPNDDTITGNAGDDVIDGGSGADTVTEAGDADFTLVEQFGLDFAFSVGAAGVDTAITATTDVAGNVYVAGTFQNTVDFDPGSATFNLTSAGGSDAYVAKYSPSGALLWANSFSGTATIATEGLAVDAAGNVYAAGPFRGTIDFDSSAGTSERTSAGDYDMYVVKMDSDGDLQWVRSAGGTGDDRALGLTLDPSGNVFAVGRYVGTVDFDPSASVSNLTSAGSRDMSLWKLDGNGDLVFARSVGGTLWDEGVHVEVDASNNAYLTGAFQGTADLDPGTGTFNVTSNGSYDVFVTKLDSAGNFLWGNSFGGSGSDSVDGMVLDSENRIFLGPAQATIFVS
jgi:probable HAF family extracellular repeat protein